MNENLFQIEWIYIVGAHSRGRTLGEYLRYLYPEISIKAYLYDNNESNPKQIEKTPVVCLDSGIALDIEYPVYIATKGVYHTRIKEKLRKKGFSKIYPVTVEFDLYLRNEYLKKYFAVAGREFIKIDKLCELEKIETAAIYIVRSAMDKPLHQAYTVKPYEKEIQAGAALTPKRLSGAGITDCTGDNISERNKQFCELTALYWLWKHAKEEIIGMVHYRRHFILPSDWLIHMQKNQVDVILPIPLYVAPSLEENYKSRHDPADWDYMMEYIKNRDEQEYREARMFFQSNLYSPCNMFIMRKKVLDELCTWLFPILFAVAAHGGQREDNYLNRYPGFLSERLLTFFFEKNRSRYKIVYSDKNFLA